MSQKIYWIEAVLHVCEWKRLLLVPDVRRVGARVGVGRVKFGGNPSNFAGAKTLLAGPRCDMHATAG